MQAMRIMGIAVPSEAASPTLIEGEEEEDEGEPDVADVVVVGAPLALSDRTHRLDRDFQHTLVSSSHNIDRLVRAS